jgi:hypothetical protein
MMAETAEEISRRPEFAKNFSALPAKSIAKA